MLMRKSGYGRCCRRQLQEGEITVASDFAAQLKEEARPFLEDGEEIIASFVAQPRGTTTSKVGGLAPQAIGGAWAGKSKKGAEAASLKLANPMALALSDRRLIVFAIETSAMGKPKAVKELVSSVPVGEVESIQVKRLLVGKTVKVSANGAEAKLEVGAGQDAKGLAEQFERVKAGA
jgi:hypothetical protein